MTKHAETFEHTADIGLTARADSLGELLEALAETLAAIICPPDPASPATDSRGVSAEAEDVEALTVDFLTEVLTAVQSEPFVVSSVKVSSADEHFVRAELLGQPYDPARHQIHTEVKAVTYHQLAIRRQDGQWTGRVILDL